MNIELIKRTRRYGAGRAIYLSSENSEINKKGLTKEDSTKYYILNEAPKIENLILAIRKELGYKNKNIKQYDILRLYINDINKYL